MLVAASQALLLLQLLRPYATASGKSLRTSDF